MQNGSDIPSPSGVTVDAENVKCVILLVGIRKGIWSVKQHQKPLFQRETG